MPVVLRFRFVTYTDIVLGNYSSSKLPGCTKSWHFWSHLLPLVPSTDFFKSGIYKKKDTRLNGWKGPSLQNSSREKTWFLQWFRLLWILGLCEIGIPFLAHNECRRGSLPCEPTTAPDRLFIGCWFKSALSNAVDAPRMPQVQASLQILTTGSRQMLGNLVQLRTIVNPEDGYACVSGRDWQEQFLYSFKLASTAMMN